jgi:hypothetical protein
MLPQSKAFFVIEPELHDGFIKYILYSVLKEPHGKAGAISQGGSSFGSDGSDPLFRM